MTQKEMLVLLLTGEKRFKEETLKYAIEGNDYIPTYTCYEVAKENKIPYFYLNDLVDYIIKYMMTNDSELISIDYFSSNIEKKESFPLYSKMWMSVKRGGSEGIYGDIIIEDDDGNKKALATAKSLDEDEKTLFNMGCFLSKFNMYFERIVACLYALIDRNGYSILVKKDGKEMPYGYCFNQLECAKLAMKQKIEKDKKIEYKLINLKTFEEILLDRES